MDPQYEILMALKRSGLTRFQLADKAEVSAEFITHLICGLYPLSGAGQMAKHDIRYYRVARALNIPVRDFVGPVTMAQFTHAVLSKTNPGRMVSEALHSCRMTADQLAKILAQTCAGMGQLPYMREFIKSVIAGTYPLGRGQCTADKDDRYRILCAVLQLPPEEFFEQVVFHQKQKLRARELKMALAELERRSQ